MAQTPKDPREKAALARLQELAGLSDAEAREMLDWSLEAARSEALEMVGGDGALPTTLAASRAARLGDICEKAQRMLKEVEVQILFRIPPSGARALITVAQATYAQALGPSLLKLIASNVSCTKTEDGKDLTYTLNFTEGSAFRTARSRADLLTRKFVKGVQASSSTIVVLRKVQFGGKTLDALAFFGIGECT